MSVTSQLNIALKLEFDISEIIKIFDSEKISKLIGQFVATEIRMNFDHGGRDISGSPNAWKPSRRAIDESGRTLVDSGLLVNSLSPQGFPLAGKEKKKGSGGITFTKGKIIVGTNVPYARKHDLGIGVPKRLIFILPLPVIEKLIKYLRTIIQKEIE